MARNIYGADGSAQVVSTSGVPTVAAATVKSAQTGGVTVTDILKLDGTALSGVVTPDARGQIVFQGPDASIATYWLDFGDGGPRWAVHPVDISAMFTLAATARELAQYTTPTGVTAKSAIPYVGNAISQKMATALDPMVIPRFATSAARDTAFPSPADGDRCFRTDLHAFQSYRNVGTARWVTDAALIGESILAADTATITFNSIPQEWRNLRLIYRARATGSPASDVKTQRVAIRLNNDTAANYATFGEIRNFKLATAVQTWETINNGTGGSATASTAASYGSASGGVSNYNVNATTTCHVGICAGSDLGTLFGGGEITIDDYTSSASRKGIKGDTGFYDNTGTAGTGYGAHARLQGGWSSSAAITRVDVIAPSATAFVAGSSFYLYGW